jgi:hypothetical protein
VFENEFCGKKLKSPLRKYECDNDMLIPESLTNQTPLEKSRMLLAKFSLSNKVLSKHNIDQSNIQNLASCFTCKKLISRNKDNECRLCTEIFCLKHRTEISHKCEKLSKDTERYLNAKNLFKLKLREVKGKAVR